MTTSVLFIITFLLKPRFFLDFLYTITPMSSYHPMFFKIFFQLLVIEHILHATIKPVQGRQKYINIGP